MPHFNKSRLLKLLSSWLPILLIGCIYALIFYGLKHHSQSWYFQDETEHLTNGWMLWRFDKNLYSQISSNHQPIPILLGAFFSKMIPYNTIYILVERIRVLMLAYIFAWSILLTWRFRWRGFYAASLMGLSSYVFFGWHLLAESLAAPMVIFNLSLLLEKSLPLQTAQTLKKTWQNKLDLLIFALSAVAMTLSLSPLWPFVLTTSLALAWQSNKAGKILLATIYLSGLGAVFLLVSPLAWYEQTITNVSKYVLDLNQAQSFQDSLTAFTYPFQSLLKPNGGVSRFFWIQIGLVGILTLGLKLRPLKTKRSWLTWLLFLVLVLSLNNRVFVFPAQFYSGFHLYPLIGGWVALVAHYLAWSLKKSDKLFLKLIVVVASSWLFFSSGFWILENKNKLNEHFVQYGDFQAAAAVISILKQPADTLLTGPNGAGYINLAADMPFTGIQLFHLPWSWRSPALRESFLKTLASEPPMFVIFDVSPGNGFYDTLKPLLERDFVYLYRLDGRKTPIQVNKTRLENLTELQKQQFSDQYFMLPQVP